MSSVCWRSIVVFGGDIFEHIIGIPMVANRASLLANLLLYSYDDEFIHDHLIWYLCCYAKAYQYTKSEAKAFNHTFMFMDDIVY